VQRIADADHIGVALYDQDSGRLRLDLIYDKAHGFSTPGDLIPLDASAAGLTFERGAAGVFRQSELGERGWPGASLMKAEGVESMCCVPLVTRSGRSARCMSAARRSRQSAALCPQPVNLSGPGQT